ncbi:hypothetical protein [Salimicrobium halophilum]|uniref:Uncharacterized protein n=1 Tax=Salimicrobium halophilum TaxID=86666 RepID=A0A1G8VK10_9BACI|nr:hypothetical protein [Salimicrobium halophilum]SDJ66227.1 hypothetical protein SAMN04490247_2745 [Salimicrobium halophilum]
MDLFRTARMIALVVVIVCFLLYTSRHTSIVSIGMGIGGAMLIATTMMIEGELKDQLEGEEE